MVATAEISARPLLSGWIGSIAQRVYATAIGARNRRFDEGRGVTRLPIPVISIGNLSVGGTGKTPMVMYIVSLLLRAGARPCIAMRGYTRGTAAHAAIPDETALYRETFPDVAVVAQPDRIAGIRAELAKAEAAARPTCVVLDDGFQHRRIARDVDIVLIDATRPPHRDRLLPAGWLREPVASLARADLVALTHTEQCEPAMLKELRDVIRRVHRGPPEIIARHVWTALREGDRTLPLDVLLGKRVLPVCAIGNPGAFLHTLRRTMHEDTTHAGAVLEPIVLRDHDPYSAETVKRVAEAARSGKAEAIVTTEKDWAKLRTTPARTFPCPVWRPVLELVFTEGREEVEDAVLAAAAPKP